MGPETSSNWTGEMTHLHPCYRMQNASYVFTSAPSISCVLVYTVLGLLSVVTTCGNLLVIVSILTFKQLHTPTNYLILSLAFADLLVGVLVFPFSMVFTVSSCLDHSDVFCQIRDGLDVTLCTSSILNLCCISIDRFYAVCRPLTYKTKVNVQVSSLMILASWGVSLLIGVCIIIAGFSQATCEDVCSVDAVLANTTGPVFSFYLPTIIMVCLYLKIFLVAQKQVHRLQSSRSGPAVSKMEMKATKTLATVMGVFLLCLMPYFLCLVFQPLFSRPPAVSMTETLNWLTLSNSTLNPFIYAFFYSCFRSAFRRIVTGRLFRDGSADLTFF